MPFPEFKAKVAVAALRGGKTLAEWAEQFAVHPVQIQGWQSPLAESAGWVFSKGQPASGSEDGSKALDAKIGPLTMARDGLDRGLEWIHGSRGKTG